MDLLQNIPQKIVAAHHICNRAYLDNMFLIYIEHPRICSPYRTQTETYPGMIIKYASSREYTFTMEPTLLSTVCPSWNILITCNGLGTFRTQCTTEYWGFPLHFARFFLVIKIYLKLIESIKVLALCMWYCKLYFVLQNIFLPDVFCLCMIY